MASVSLPTATAYIVAGITVCLAYTLSRRTRIPSGTNVLSKRRSFVYVGEKNQFPAKWWSDDEELELERRAVFSKVGQKGGVLIRGSGLQC